MVSHRMAQLTRAWGNIALRAWPNGRPQALYCAAFAALTRLVTPVADR